VFNIKYSSVFCVNKSLQCLWEDLFTQNTEEYCMLSIVGRFIYTKYWGILYVEHCGKIIPTMFNITYSQVFYVNKSSHGVQHKYFLVFCVHCGKIYLHKIPRNIVCWALWEDLFTQNTEEYCMLSTVGRLFTQNT
jgi:hypothetical protein